MAGAAAVFLIAACGADSTGATAPQASATAPWSLQLQFGNSAFNTKEVTTISDVASGSALADFVSATVLPNTNLEVYTTHVYVPWDSTYDTRVTNASVIVQRTDGSRTGNVFQESHFVQNSTLDGQTYRVFQVNGFFIGTPAITPTTFTSVAYSFSVEYRNSLGTVVNSSEKSIRITKR
jgi:hypothetical protein